MTCFFFFFFLGGWDIRSCVEQLQVIEREVKSLLACEKDLATLCDQLEEKKIERSELHAHIEVRVITNTVHVGSLCRNVHMGAVRWSKVGE